MPKLVPSRSTKFLTCNIILRVKLAPDRVVISYIPSNLSVQSTGMLVSCMPFGFLLTKLSVFVTVLFFTHISVTCDLVFIWIDYLVDEGTECNSTSDLLMERNREQGMVDLLIPSLVLLNILLQKLQVCSNVILYIVSNLFLVFWLDLDRNVVLELVISIQKLKTQQIIFGH